MSTYLRRFVPISGILVMGSVSVFSQYALFEMINQTPDSKIKTIANNPGLSENEKKRLRDEYISNRYMDIRSASLR